MKPALASVLSTVKGVIDNHKYGKMVTEWNNCFKNLSAISEDIAGFRKAVRDNNLSESEKERCQKLLDAKEKEANGLRSEEKALRAKLDVELVEAGKKPLIDAIRLSLAKDVFTEYIGEGTEGLVDTFDRVMTESGDSIDKFIVASGTQISQMIDGTKDIAADLYERRIKELTEASKNIPSVDQRSLLFKIPPLKADGTVDKEILDAKEKAAKEELSQWELKALIVKGITYYSGMLKKTKKDSNDSVRNSFNAMIRDIRETLRKK